MYLAWENTQRSLFSVCLHARDTGSQSGGPWRLAIAFCQHVVDFFFGGGRGGGGGGVQVTWFKNPSPKFIIIPVPIVSVTWVSPYNTGPYINIPHYGKRNVGKVSYLP